MKGYVTAAGKEIHMNYRPAPKRHTFEHVKICTCEACRYTFRYPLIPPRCPDCGHAKVREARRNEIKEYHRMQKILAEEIRLGIYGAVAG